MSKRLFDHEKLNVYHESLRFVAWATTLLERVPKNTAIYSQLDRASTSIPLNIAEGSGKFTPPDKCRFYDNARGSGLECAAALDVLVAKKIVEAPDIEEGKESLYSTVSMLVGLIKATAPNRVFEEGPLYRISQTEQVKVKDQD